MAAYLRLQETSSVVAKFAEASAEKQPKAHEKQRISPRNVFDKRGSATGLEAMAMMKAKHDDNQAEKMEKTARDEERKQKKALDVAATVTHGARVLQALEMYGEAQLHKLMIAEIVALLIHADPQGTNPKPKNKKEGLERVRALSTAHDALERRALAVVATAAPDIPLAAPAPVLDALPPPPY